MSLSVESETSKTSKIHMIMFGISIMGEINNLRRQINSNDSKLIYVSNTLSQFELFIEMYYAYLNKPVEPIVCAWECFKAILRLKEYVGLITKEKIAWYISKELYETHKQDEEKKKSTVLLPRTNKALPKPDDFPISKKLMKHALKSIASVDSMQSLDDVQQVSGSDRFKNISVQRINQGGDANKGIFAKMLAQLKFLKKLLCSRKFKIIEILLILRPFIYMYMLIKLGQNSYKPFFVSLIIEIIGILMSIQRVAFLKTDAEKLELQGRWKGLFKYLLKERFWSQYTVKIIHTLLYRIINDRKIGFVLSILDYFKYYWYTV